MKPLVWRVWVQATMPSKCLRTIRATSFIGSTLEPVSKGTQIPAQARETARSGGRLHGFLPGRGDHRDGRSTLSKRALSNDEPARKRQKLSPEQQDFLETVAKINPDRWYINAASAPVYELDRDDFLIAAKEFRESLAIAKSKELHDRLQSQQNKSSFDKSTRDKFTMADSVAKQMIDGS